MLVKVYESDGFSEYIDLRTIIAKADGNIFEVEEIVWSAKDCGLAKVLSELTHENVSGVPYKARIDYEKIYGSKAYTVYVLEKGDYSNTYFPHVTVGGHYSTSLAHDLGKLDHLIDVGVDLSRL